MNILTKIRKARNACLDEWIENYEYHGDDETLKMCQHNRVFPKIALVGIIILLILTLVVII